MITPILIQIFEQGLTKLAEEINLYPDDASLWTPIDGIKNPGGNLSLHLTGSLQHFLGAILGESGYVRNREGEFKVKNITRAKLLDEIEAARVAVKDALEQVSKKELEKDYPVVLFEKPVSTEYMLVYFVGHFNYHLGQINYHRRIVTDKAKQESA